MGFRNLEGQFSILPFIQSVRQSVILLNIHDCVESEHPAAIESAYACSCSTPGESETLGRACFGSSMKLSREALPGRKCSASGGKLTVALD